MRIKQKFSSATLSLSLCLALTGCLEGPAEQTFSPLSYPEISHLQTQTLIWPDGLPEDEYDGHLTEEQMGQLRDRYFGPVETEVRTEAELEFALRSENKMRIKLLNEIKLTSSKVIQSRRILFEGAKLDFNNNVIEVRSPFVSYGWDFYQSDVGMWLYARSGLVRFENDLATPKLNVTGVAQQLVFSKGAIFGDLEIRNNHSENILVLDEIKMETGSLKEFGSRNTLLILNQLDLNRMPQELYRHSVGFHSVLVGGKFTFGGSTPATVDWPCCLDDDVRNQNTVNSYSNYGCRLAGAYLARIQRGWYLP